MQYPIKFTALSNSLLRKRNWMMMTGHGSLHQAETLTIKNIGSLIAEHLPGVSKILSDCKDILMLTSCGSLLDQPF